MSALEREQALGAVVKFFCWDVWAAFKALRTHVPDQWGNCAGCGGTNPVVPYPCLVVLCAQRAVDIVRPRIGR